MSECHVYVVASKPIGDDWPKGDCFRCKKPLREHEKRVSMLAPPATGYVIDEEVMHPRPASATTTDVVPENKTAAGDYGT